MPTTPRKARHLLKQDKATVFKNNPFTIKLKYATGETKQPITLGIDSGYKYIGFSAITAKRELVSGDVILRTDIKRKLQKRKMYRLLKRNRLWYRQPRFNNRTRYKGWLAPSIRHKVNSHLMLIKKIKSMLPITKVIIEVANFNTQKMQNPEIKGIEYQQGELQGYHVREYLLDKWNRKCAYCGKRNIPLEVEHIIPKSRDGTNRVSNLTLSCKQCNIDKGTMTAEEFGFPEIQKKAKQSLKTTAFMNIVKLKIVDALSCEYTYGYITKHNRINANIDKSHVNDAFVIAKGKTQERTKAYTVNQIRRNNRCLQRNRKGFKPAIRRKRYKLQPHNLVKYNNRPYKVIGVHNLGKNVILDNNKSVNINKVQLYNYMRGLQFDSQKQMSHLQKKICKD